MKTCPKCGQTQLATEIYYPVVDTYCYVCGFRSYEYLKSQNKRSNTGINEQSDLINNLLIDDIECTAN